MTKTIIIQIIASLLLLLFLYTGLSKLLAHNLFLFSLHNTAIPLRAIKIISWGLPVTEVIVAFLLFFPRTQMIGFFASATLLIVFAVYIAYMLLYIPNLSCSCGGVMAFLSWPQHLCFNLFFIAISIVAIIFKKQKINAENAGHLSPPDSRQPAECKSKTPY